MLSATLDELADHGYSGFEMERLARRAGVNKTTIYRRWPSKGSLLADALLFGSDEIAPIDTGDFRRDLLALYATGPAASTDRDPLSQAVAITRALDAVIDDPEVQAARDQLWARRLDIIREAVNRACERGELAPGADPELIMDVLFGAFHTRVVARGKPATPDFIERIFDIALQAWSTLDRGLQEHS